ncbi:MAG: CoA transferase [Dehalococcoidia bacterium]|nr:CoA transferase [Dehalococcoidia bacterium]
MTNPGPLAGVRVLEFAGWNGVLAGRLLADDGADVVRVVPLDGDPLASEPPFARGRSLQEAWYNAGKRVVRVDAGTTEGGETIARLIAGADILIEDWEPAGEPAAPGTLAANPALVRVSVTPFGHGAPHAWHVNDLIASALCGSASVTGTAATRPLPGWGNQTHNTVGMYAAICALAGLRAARLTGRGTHIDLSAHEALVSCTEQVLMEWFFPGVWGPARTVAPRQGAIHWSGAYDIFPGRDGRGAQVSVALRLAETILPWLMEEGAAQDLADPERYPNVVAMIRNLPYLMSVVGQWVAGKDTTELFHTAQEKHLPWSVVLSVPEALASPQIAARNYITEASGDDTTLPFPGRFYRIGEVPWEPSLSLEVPPGDVAWPVREQGGAGTHLPRTRPLEGIRVLDFTHVLAGPFGTRVLGDLGADVIKVSTGSRSSGANSPSHAYFTSWNRNKRNISLDMSRPEGRAVARRLALECDVIVENFSAGVLARWGLDRAGLEAGNPRITVVSMGGMGQDGPWSRFVTFAPTIHALTGLSYLTNPAGNHLLGYGFSLTDHLSGLLGAVASLAGVEQARRTGHGMSVDLAQYEAGLGILGPTLMDALANGTRHEPVGARHPFDVYAPHGVYPAAGDDEWVAIAVRGDAEFGMLCAVMGQPALAGDARFATHAGRLANADALDALIDAWTAGQDRYAVMEACQAAGIAAGAVQRAPDLVSRDANLAARGFFTTTHSEPWGEHGIDAFPARFDGERPPRYDGVHGLGADTFAVLTELLGIDDEAFAALAAAGALA